MRTRAHIVASLLPALLLYRRRPAAALALLAGGVLIDVDHWFAYISQTGDWTLSGVWRFARYRGRERTVGDTLPRYETLRTRLHQPLIVLPPLWWLARRGDVWRGLAIGVSLHLLMDYLEWPCAAAAVWRARGSCPRCGRRRRLEPLWVRDGSRWGRWTATCRPCREQPAVVY